MKGSDKQIKWATDIKEAITWDGVNDHPIITAAKTLICQNDDASWWIDNRNRTGYSMIRSMLTGGLMISNRGNAKTAAIRKDGSAIDITWTEIIADGKGGHHEDKSQTITA